MSTRLSILLVNFNTQAYLQRCLAALAPHNEVVVVDNHSNDDSVAMLRAHFPWIKVLCLPDNLGFAKAINLAASHATGDMLLLLSPDTVLSLPACSAVVAAMASAPECGCMGFRQVDAQNQFRLAMGPAPSPLADWAWQRLVTQLEAGNRRVAARLDQLFTQRLPVGWVSASSLCVRRSVFWQVGGFDENYFLAFADQDFCLRLGQQVGPVLYEPSITVQHDGNSSKKVFPDITAAAYFAGKKRFFRQYHDPVSNGWLTLRQQLQQMSMWR